jgi:hypothetical protein
MGQSFAVASPAGYLHGFDAAFFRASSELVRVGIDAGESKGRNRLALAGQAAALGGGSACGLELVEAHDRHL